MEPTDTTPPMNYGRRIIPRLVDDIAQSDPQRPFVSIPKSSTLEEGYEDVTYSKFANLVNACAWWLESHLGRGKLGTLLYIGPLDVRYLVMILAAAKTGHVVSYQYIPESVEWC